MNTSVDARRPETAGDLRVRSLRSAPQDGRVLARSLRRVEAAVHGRNTGVATFNSAI